MRPIRGAAELSRFWDNLAPVEKRLRAGLISQHILAASWPVRQVEYSIESGHDDSRAMGRSIVTGQSCRRSAQIGEKPQPYTVVSNANTAIDGRSRPSQFEQFTLGHDTIAMFGQRQQ